MQGIGYVYFNERLVKELPFKDPIGQIKGVTFEFRGYGSVDFVELFNHQRQLVYKEEFE